MYQSNDRYETYAERESNAREDAARLDRECELAHEEALALELADAAEQDALDAVTIYEYTDNSWLGIADGPVTIRRAA
jgi:hypothetical protein